VTLVVGDVAPRLALDGAVDGQSSDSKSNVDPNAGRGATSPTVVLLPSDIVITTQQAAEWVSTDERGVQIALSTHLTPELLQEGIARDFVRQVQQLRKEANLEIQDRIQVGYATDDADVLAALQSWGEYIRGETLADVVSLETTVPADVKPVTIGNVKLPIWITVK
jgi:isoleucyl-tRNA synthetase